MSNVRLKLAKNQTKTKQHPESELLLFQNYLLFSSTLSPKKTRRYSRKYTKEKVRLFKEVIQLMTMKIRLEMKNRSHRYDINKPRSIHEHKHAKYKMRLSIMMVTCTKQHLSKI